MAGDYKEYGLNIVKNLGKICSVISDLPCTDWFQDIHESDIAANGQFKIFGSIPIVVHDGYRNTSTFSYLVGLLAHLTIQELQLQAEEVRINDENVQEHEKYVLFNLIAQWRVQYEVEIFWYPLRSYRCSLNISRFSLPSKMNISWFFVLFNIIIWSHEPFSNANYT